MALALPFFMELVLQRYSWAGDALAVVLSAYLIARTVSTVAAVAIAPKPAVLMASATPPATSQPKPLELDAEKMAKLFDVPLPKAALVGTQTADGRRGGWDRAVRSPLHGTLIGTAIADPLRYSLCQITNPDVNETQRSEERRVGKERGAAR